MQNTKTRKILCETSWKISLGSSSRCKVKRKNEKYVAAAGFFWKLRHIVATSQWPISWKIDLGGQTFQRKVTFNHFSSEFGKYSGFWCMMKAILNFLWLKYVGDYGFVACGFHLKVCRIWQISVLLSSYSCKKSKLISICTFLDEVCFVLNKGILMHW